MVNYFGMIILCETTNNNFLKLLMVQYYKTQGWNTRGYNIQGKNKHGMK